jgi:Ca-activated chloride channel family protein
MPITNRNKTMAPAEIPLNGSIQVTLSISGEPEILQAVPKDIMLVLDRSGSMSGDLPDLKVAANQLIDIVDQSTDGVQDGIIGGGSRIGVVSFDSDVTLDQPLNTNTNALKAAINNLIAGGGTDTTQAFQTAQTALTDSNPGSKKILIIFTDGLPNDPTTANAAATAVRAAGIEIYAIGLGTTNSITLNNWATPPADTHVVIAPTPDQLITAFQNIATAITRSPSATNIVITDTVNGDFSVSNIIVSKGATQLVGNTITWQIDSLAATGPEIATLSYTVTHNPDRGGGVKRANSSTTYADAQGHQVVFPDPTVLVRVPAPSVPPPATSGVTGIARGKLREVVPPGRFKDELLNEMNLIDQLLAMSNIQGALEVLFIIEKKVKNRMELRGCDTAFRLNLLLKDLELLEQAIALMLR